jgi:hypothetical protein
LSTVQAGAREPEGFLQLKALYFRVVIFFWYIGISTFKVPLMPVLGSLRDFYNLKHFTSGL